MGGGGSAPKAPKLKQVNIPAAAALATKYDTEGYKRSDTDLEKRFPSLIEARNFNISDAIRQLSGKLPMQSMSALETAGLGAEGKRIEGGNEFQTSRNLGQQILAKEQRDRNYFENELGANPERQIGLTGADVVRIAEGNTGNTNALNQAMYGSALNNYSSTVQQNAQNFGALTGLIGGLATNFAKAYKSSTPYTDPFAWGGYSFNPGGDYGGRGAASSYYAPGGY